MTAVINQATQLLTCQMNELAHKLQQNNNTSTETHGDTQMFPSLSLLLSVSLCLSLPAVARVTCRTAAIRKSIWRRASLRLVSTKQRMQRESLCGICSSATPCLVPPLPASGTLAASVSTATSVETLVMNSRSITQSIETVSSVNQSVKTARWQTFPLTNRSCENTCAISQTEFQRKCFDFDNTSLWFSVYFKHPVKGGTQYVAVVVMA